MISQTTDRDVTVPRILIVDDHEVLREGIRTLIKKSRPNWEICGEAASGGEALASAAALKPSVLVLDITMPGMNGLEAASRIFRLDPECRIVIFTMHQSATIEAEVRSVGAQGFVLKSEASQNLILAIETVLAGGTFYGTPLLPQKPEAHKGPSGMAFWWTLTWKPA
jgi:DNA-binding NarL/FixJ family response regulator